MLQGVGVLIGEERSGQELLQAVALAEGLGYDSVWFGEHLGQRDALVSMGAAAAVTRGIKIGSSAISVYTRNVGVVAAALETLSELAPGRVMLGVAAGEEALDRFGVRKERPVRAAREFIRALRLLMSGEEVSFEGELVRLRSARARRAQGIPILLAATGPGMLRLAAEVADGVIINFLTNDAYMRRAREIIKGARSYRLFAVSVSGRGPGLEEKAFLAKFIYLAPDFFKSMGVDGELVDSVASRVRGWPPSPGDLGSAAGLIPDELVEELMAVGPAHEVAEKVLEESGRWGTYPIIYVAAGDQREAMKALAAELGL